MTSGQLPILLIFKYRSGLTAQISEVCCKTLRLFNDTSEHKIIDSRCYIGNEKFVVP
jgi:hypothetical protein